MSNARENQSVAERRADRGCARWRSECRGSPSASSAGDDEEILARERRADALRICPTNGADSTRTTAVGEAKQKERRGACAAVPSVIRLGGCYRDIGYPVVSMDMFSAVVTLFLIMDPLGNIPVFLSILKQVAPRGDRRC